MSSVKLYAAGQNDYGQLGVGGAAGVNQWTEVELPSLLGRWENAVPVAVSASAGASNNHSLLIARTDAPWYDPTALFAWGSNSKGQLGLPRAVTGRDRPALVELPLHGPDFVHDNGFVKVAAGYEFSLALWRDGAVTGCGDNSCGQLTGSEPEIFVDDGYDVEQSGGYLRGAPEIFRGRNWQNDFSDIAAGGWHTMIAMRKSDYDAPWDYVGNQLWACGGNDRGQLGLGDRSDRNVFTLSADNALTVACGEAHSVITKVNRARWVVETWVCGANDAGQCLLPPSADILTWTHVPGLDVRCTLERPVPPVIVAGGNETMTSGGGGSGGFVMGGGGGNGGGNGGLGNISFPGGGILIIPGGTNGRNHGVTSNETR